MTSPLSRREFPPSVRPPKRGTVPLYHVDAFVGPGLRGNPAAVVLLDAWPDESVLQAVAEENRLPETAFLVPREEDGSFGLRWFSPVTEVPLCGHATLAAAHVLFEETERARETIRFSTRSGELLATRRDGTVLLDFPAATLRPLPPAPDLAPFLGGEILALYAYGSDGLAVLPGEDAVRRSRVPDPTILGKFALRGLCVTARGETVDFVSRFFAPALGIPEDPVTGSAHCALAPYWGERLGRTRLEARQLSPRGGEVVCVCQGERVLLEGRSLTYLHGFIVTALADLLA